MLKGSDGSINKVKISTKYLPINMSLDPSESMSNMGSLRVDVLDASNLPSADRNGYSDPYCKFELNGEGVYKTKVQKKTLQPVWNESFQTNIKSRTAAKLSVRVMDWDFGDKADFLGAANIDLTMLEPQLAKDVSLTLDGKSGTIRLRLLFKSAYVTRSRQRSSTFSGTMAPATKVLGAPVKGVGKVGGGVVKGASFLKNSFKSSKDMPNGTPTADSFLNDGSVPIPSIEHPGSDTAANGASQRVVSGSSSMAGVDSSANNSTRHSMHNRVASFGSKSAVGGAPGQPNAGQASFTIVSAFGFPATAKVSVHVKQVLPKGHKEVYKTKSIKSSSGQCQWDGESFKVHCAPDCQFLIQVKDDKRFGTDDLGEALYFIDDAGSGTEKALSCAGGTVTIKSSFSQQAEGAGLSTSPKAAARRSFLGRRDTSRQGMPS